MEEKAATNCSGNNKLCLTGNGGDDAAMHVPAASAKTTSVVCCYIQLANVCLLLLLALAVPVYNTMVAVWRATKRRDCVQLQGRIGVAVAFDVGMNYTNQSSAAANASVTSSHVTWAAVDAVVEDGLFLLSVICIVVFEHIVDRFGWYSPPMFPVVLLL